MKSYLAPDQLSGFENYKYSAKDTSPLSNYVMHPFWNTVVKLCPRKVAPNVLTFVGFLFTVANFVILSVYDPYYYASSEEPPGSSYPLVPDWIWLVCAMNHFLAHTLDGIDGKQARRTGTSGPLGELFDHGLDSWTSFFIPACVWSMFGRADYSISPFRFYFVLWNVLTTFYISHFEKYLTKVLFLPWGYDVSQIVILTMYLVTGIYGSHVWKFEFYGIKSGVIFEGAMYLGSLGSSLPMSFYNIYRSYKDETGKMLGFKEAFRPLFTLVLFFILSYVWTVESPNGILEAQPRLYMYLIGTVFANINCRLIVSQMSNTRCEFINWLLFPFSLTVILALLFPSIEMYLLIALTVLATLAHLHYGICVVRQMCAHFNIKCFLIKDRGD
ncbi:Ethanolaminephosphotransferase 1 [Armadillidium nasatum]|uniref:Ethanolaminephosphotransferase 1 n=1 Tax=Armadillidium nasatum TaxID=96803 RepID=A0A5N5SR27_9CRUS|nr:Ethanolaminephosphotransferase 1 [Armadillidium nasatum]